MIVSLVNFSGLVKTETFDAFAFAFALALAFVLALAFAFAFALAPVLALAFASSLAFSKPSFWNSSDVVWIGHYVFSTILILGTEVLLAFDFLSDLRAFRADSIQFPKTGK